MDKKTVRPKPGAVTREEDIYKNMSKVGSTTVDVPIENLVGKQGNNPNLCRIGKIFGLAYPETIEIVGNPPRIKSIKILPEGEKKKLATYSWKVVDFIKPGHKEYLEKLYLKNKSKPKNHPARKIVFLKELRNNGG